MPLILVPFGAPGSVVAVDPRDTASDINLCMIVSPPALSADYCPLHSTPERVGLLIRPIARRASIPTESFFCPAHERGRHPYLFSRSVHRDAID